MSESVHGQIQNMSVQGRGGGTQGAGVAHMHNCRWVGVWGLTVVPVGPLLLAVPRLVTVASASLFMLVATTL